MVMSFCYWMLRRLLELIVLRGRRDVANEVELLVVAPGGRRAAPAGLPAALPAC